MSTAGGFMTYGWTEDCRQDFIDPPKYNIDAARAQTLDPIYITGNNKWKVRVIRLSRPYYCLISL